MFPSVAPTRTGLTVSRWAGRDRCDVLHTKQQLNLLNYGSPPAHVIHFKMPCLEVIREKDAKSQIAPNQPEVLRFITTEHTRRNLPRNFYLFLQILVEKIS